MEENPKSRLTHSDSRKTEHESPPSRLQQSADFSAVSTNSSMATALSINGYKIIGTLGRGSYGEVVLAEKKEGGQIVAIKKLEKQFFEKMNKIYQVLNERTIMAELAHPGIPKLYSFFQSPKMFYFVMEYLAGGEFGDIIKNHESSFLSLFMDLAE